MPRSALPCAYENRRFLVLGLQVHVGAPMKVEFKDIRLKRRE